MPILGSFGSGSGRGFGQNSASSPFIKASGGTIVEDGDYKIHIFTSPGTFEIEKAPDPLNAYTDYMVIAGRGGSSHEPRGGAAGGFRESVPAPAAWTASPIANSGGALPVSVGSYPISIGANAAPQPSICSQGNVGGPTSYSTISSTGGGGSGGGHGGAGCFFPGGPGGCGGSGGGYPPNPGVTGGSGNAGSYSPPEGQNGYWDGGGGATSTGGSAGSGNGAGTAIALAQDLVGVPGPTPGVRYFSGGSGQGGSGTGNSPVITPTGTALAYGGAGGPGGLVVIKYRVK